MISNQTNISSLHLQYYTSYTMISHHTDILSLRSNQATSGLPSVYNVFVCVLVFIWLDEHVKNRNWEIK